MCRERLPAPSNAISLDSLWGSYPDHMPLCAAPMLYKGEGEAQMRWPWLLGVLSSGGPSTIARCTLICCERSASVCAVSTWLCARVCFAPHSPVMSVPLSPLDRQRPPRRHFSDVMRGGLATVITSQILTRGTVNRVLVAGKSASNTISPSADTALSDGRAGARCSKC